MLKFKTARGAKRFQVLFISSSLLVFFSRPIWDIVLRPVYDAYKGFQESRRMDKLTSAENGDRSS